MNRGSEDLRPLPMRPRPTRADSVDSYIIRLANANHLAPSYLHAFLGKPPHYSGRPRLARLAALCGRTVSTLQHALSDLRCGHCNQLLPPAGIGRPLLWCSPVCRGAAWREAHGAGPPGHRVTTRTVAHRTVIGATHTDGICPRCGAVVQRGVRGRRRIWCSPTCKVAAWQQAHGAVRPRPRVTTAAVQPPRAISVDGTCLRCGAVVPRAVRGRHRIWCSPRCRLAAWEAAQPRPQRRMQPLSTVVDRTDRTMCQWCGEMPHSAGRRPGRPRIWCSRSCQMAAWRSRAKHRSGPDQLRQGGGTVIRA
jgi:endogenous inhibitor of DNA gyrase (YacG/DUF329 family)